MMYKPVYLIPFIFVYRVILSVTKFIIKLISYSLRGFYVSGKSLFLGTIKFLRYVSLGFIWCIVQLKIIIRFGQYVVKGIVFILRFIIFILMKIFHLFARIISYLYHIESLGVIVTSKAFVKITLYMIDKIKKGCLVSSRFIYGIFHRLCYFSGHGFIISCVHVKHFFEMVVLGVDVLLYYTRRGFEVTIGYGVLKYKQYIAYRKHQKELAHQRRVSNEVKKEKEREEKLRVRAKERARRHEIYIDKAVELEKKPTFGDKINKALTNLTNLPKKMNKTSVGAFFVKKNHHKEEFNKEVLNLDLLEEEKENEKVKKGKKKSEGKILYEYVAKNKSGKTIKGYFEAFNKMEVRSFLINEGLEAYSIRTNRWITLLHRDTASGNVKIKTKDLVFFLTQLSTYIKAGIPLAESLDILSRQFKNKHYQRIIKSLVYDLNLGVSFSEAMDKQGKAFPRLLINMVRASEMTGSLPEVLDDQAEYFDQMEQTRKQMITAMMYPSIVFIIAIGVLTFVMLFVVPQFVDIFESMDASAIPGITLFIMNMSEFMKKYFIWIMLGFVLFLLIMRYLYKNVTLIRRWMQVFAMHLPVFGNVIIYNEVTTFTKTFSSLMAHNVFITDTMNILKKITNNEIYKELINETIKNLSTGEKISLAFQNHWAFPIPAYEMLVTGERTGELPEMMGKVSLYYQDLHKNAVARIKIFIEPMLIIMLTAMVGLIVLAIIVPMFKMYGAIQGA